MRVCDLATPSNRLQRATVALRDQWRETKETWSDATSGQFERRYLQSLLPPTQAALIALQEFAEKLADAEQACNDERPAE